jgi:hypothetical protein
MRSGTVLLMLAAIVMAAPQPQSTSADLPSRGQSIVIDDMRVTLLGATGLSRDQYRDATGDVPPAWRGEAVRIVFLVENRIGTSLIPVLGGVRVTFAGRPYNAVINATSRDPFAPDINIRAVADFFATTYGATLPRTSPRQGAPADVLDVFIRGDAIPAGATGTVELEQGETHRLNSRGQLEALGPRETIYKWFRFQLPPLK